MNANDEARLNDDRLADETWGQGSFGVKCSLCGADNYYVPVVHKPGCDELWPQVKALRALCRPGID